MSGRQSVGHTTNANLGLVWGHYTRPFQLSGNVEEEKKERVRKKVEESWWKVRKKMNERLENDKQPKKDMKNERKNWSK